LEGRFLLDLLDFIIAFKENHPKTTLTENVG